MQYTRERGNESERVFIKKTPPEPNTDVDGFESPPTSYSQEHPGH
jgi:hypothetical protein